MREETQRKKRDTEFALAREKILAAEFSSSSPNQNRVKEEAI